MRKILIFTILLIPTCAAIFLAYYFYLKNNNVMSQEMTSAEVIKRVSVLVELPEGEEPTVATVSNLETLKDQPFFNKASIGDKVLIFSVSGKVILYSPSRDIILDISPLRFEPSN